MPPAKSRNGGHDEVTHLDSGLNSTGAGHGGGKGSRDGKDGASAGGSHHHASKDKSAHHGNSGDGHSASTAPAAHASSNGKIRRVASSTGSNARESLGSSSLAVPSGPPLAIGAGSLSLHPSGSASAPSGAPVAVSQDPASIGLDWTTVDREFLHAYRRSHRLSTPTAFKHDYHQWILSRPGSIGMQSPTMLRRKAFRRQGQDVLAGVVRKHHNAQAVQENDIIAEFVHKVRTVDGGDRLGSSPTPAVASASASGTGSASKPPARSRRKDAQTQDAQK